MVDNGALGSESTRPRTRISTFLIQASQIALAFLVYYTFRSAIWWTSDIRWLTRAWRCSSDISAFRIRSAWWWYTRIDVFRLWSWRRRRCKIGSIRKWSLSFTCESKTKEVTYEVWGNNVWKDPQYVLADNCISENGLWPDIVHSNHKFQDMGRYISDLYKHDSEDIPLKPCTQADSLVDCQYTVANMSTQLVHLLLYTGC